MEVNAKVHPDAISMDDLRNGLKEVDERGCGPTGDIQTALVEEDDLGAAVIDVRWDRVPPNMLFIRKNFAEAAEIDRDRVEVTTGPDHDWRTIRVSAPYQ